MKKYSSAAVAIALGISETAIETQFEGASKKGVDLAQILMLDNNKSLKRYAEEAELVKLLLESVKSLER